MAGKPTTPSRCLCKRIGANMLYAAGERFLFFRVGVWLWSRRQDLNLQPADYKSDALPLRHAGRGKAKPCQVCLQSIEGNVGLHSRRNELQRI